MMAVKLTSVQLHENHIVGKEVIDLFVNVFGIWDAEPCWVSEGTDR